jgi:hypothetical protein
VVIGIINDGKVIWVIWAPTHRVTGITVAAAYTLAKAVSAVV